MSVVEFDYSYYAGEKSPIVPIHARGRDDRWYRIWIYVDSGATCSVFLEEEAQRLGIDIESGFMDLTTVADGGLMPVYYHKLRVKFGSEEMEAEIGFSRKLGVGINVLGRRDFFDEFKICFDQAEDIISFERKIALPPQ